MTQCDVALGDLKEWTMTKFKADDLYLRMGTSIVHSTIVIGITMNLPSLLDKLLWRPPILISEPSIPFLNTLVSG